MKTSNFTIRIAMLALFACVLVYFGFYIFQSYRGGLTTVAAYTDTVDVGVEASGLLVREESVITIASGSATVELSPSEGEKVAAGDVVATLYTSASGLDVKQSIRLLEAELEQLEYALRASASPTDSARVERDLAASIAGLHASACGGDLTDLEHQALQLRTLVFKRDFTYGDASATQELRALITEKTAQLDDLRASLGAVSTTVRATRPGIFSGLADGYEGLITPAMLNELTPSQLSELMRQSPSPPADAVGTLITSSTWYFAAAVHEAQAAHLRAGRTYSIQFSRDYSGQVPMTLERISDPENGRVVLIFSTRSALSDTTLLRRQSVDIITEQITGIRIPRSTLRALSQTVKRTVVDEQTGEKTTVEEEVIVTGVYTVVSSQAEFNPVNVLYQGEDFFLVEPADPDAAVRLREGDELILSTAGIYAGKVVR